MIAFLLWSMLEINLKKSVLIPLSWALTKRYIHPQCSAVWEMAAKPIFKEWEILHCKVTAWISSIPVMKVMCLPSRHRNNIIITGLLKPEIDTENCAPDACYHLIAPFIFNFTFSTFN